MFLSYTPKLLELAKSWNDHSTIFKAVRIGIEKVLGYLAGFTTVLSRIKAPKKTFLPPPSNKVFSLEGVTSLKKRKISQPQLLMYIQGMRRRKVVSEGK